MKELISVIVPVYNVEKYLKRCVESICTQTYENLEIILVDDGSTDSSGKICDEFSMLDKRIVVIHKKNGGLSDARNAGMTIARGEYICFFDSDDWVEPYVIKKAYDTIKKTRTDVAIWGFSKDFVDAQENVLKSQKLEVPSSVCKKEDKEYFRFADEIGLSLIGYAWNKLYKRSVLVDNNIKFMKGVSLVEDMLFNANTLIAVKSISFIKSVGSHYIQRARETLGAKFYSDYYELKIKACRAREDVLKAYGASEIEAHEIMKNSYFAAIKSACRMACKSESLNSKETYAYMKNVCRSNEAKSIIKTYQAIGKDKLFRYAFLLKQYWIFEVMYRK